MGIVSQKYVIPPFSFLLSPPTRLVTHNVLAAFSVFAVDSSFRGRDERGKENDEKGQREGQKRRVG